MTPKLTGKDCAREAADLLDAAINPDPSNRSYLCRASHYGEVVALTVLADTIAEYKNLLAEKDQRIEDLMQVKPGNGWWIPHDGGPCPVPGDRRVYCLQRDGTIFGPEIAWAVVWYYDDPDSDIIAYHPIEESK